MAYYRIADFDLYIVGDVLEKAVAAISGFEVFKKSKVGSNAFVFEYTDTDELPVIDKALYENEVFGIKSQFGTCEGGYRFDHGREGEEGLYLYADNNKGHVVFKGNLQVDILRFSMWIGLGILMAPYKAVAIHTSTIVLRDKGVLFLGESGTGKSTHTRLWRENINGAVLLNDDSPIVRIINGRAFVYGSPWSGKTPCYKDECHELAGCVRLSQAPFNEIKKLNVVQSYAALHPSCPPNFAYDDYLYDCISDVLNDIICAVPVYHLACLPNAEAAKLSCKTVFGL